MITTMLSAFGAYVITNSSITENPLGDTTLIRFTHGVHKGGKPKLPGLFCNIRMTRLLVGRSDNGDDLVEAQC